MSEITRRTLLTGAATAPLVLAQRGRQPDWTPPNIMLIVADDLGAWMCGCYGSEEIQTPGIDLLARTGTRFNTGYAGSPAGPASRATLLTGLTQAQHGVEASLATGPGSSQVEQAVLPDSFSSRTMVSDLLSGNGWRCGFIGKWGLGDASAPGHGYEYSYMLADDSSSLRDPVVYRNGERAEESGYAPELVTAAAGEFLKAQSPDTRFFLTLSYPGSRAPSNEHPQRFLDMYADAPFRTIGYQPAAANARSGAEALENTVASLRLAAAGVSAFDDQVQALLDVLREHEVWSDTLVVLTSDTGQLLGRHGLWGDGLASDPVNLYEEVMRVPFIWSWPGEVPVEAVRPELVSVYDVLPSLLEACQLPASAPGVLGGRSCLPLATGGLSRDDEPWPTGVYGSYGDAAMARDSRYKLIERNGGQGPNELYDLRTDPRESRNEYANAGFSSVRERLTDRLAGWRSR